MYSFETVGQPSFLDTFTELFQTVEEKYVHFLGEGIEKRTPPSAKEDVQPPLDVLDFPFFIEWDWKRDVGDCQAIFRNSIKAAYSLWRFYIYCNVILMPI